MTCSKCQIPVITCWKYLSAMVDVGDLSAFVAKCQETIGEWSKII